MSGTKLAREAGGFLVLGAINTAVTLVLYQLFLLFMAPAVAYTVMFACGIVLSALLYSRFLFQVTLSLRTFVAYTLFYLLSYGLGLLLLMLFVEGLRIDGRIAIFLVVGITTPVNFVGARLTLNWSKGWPASH